LGKKLAVGRNVVAGKALLVLGKTFRALQYKRSGSKRERVLPGCRRIPNGTAAFLGDVVPGKIQPAVRLNGEGGPLFSS